MIWTRMVQLIFSRCLFVEHVHLCYAFVMTYNIHITFPDHFEGLVQFTIDAGLLKKEDRAIPEDRLREQFTQTFKSTIDLLNDGIATIEVPVAVWYTVAREIEKSLLPANKTSQTIYWITQDENKVFLDQLADEQIYEVGSTTIKNSIRIGDPNYDWKDVCNIEVVQGNWCFEISCKPHGSSQGITSMLAYHNELDLDDLNSISEDDFFEQISVDSGAVAMYFDPPTEQNTMSRDEIIKKIIKNIDNKDSLPMLFDNSLHTFVANTFYGDGLYEIQVLWDENDRALAIKAILTPFGIDID